MLFELRDGVRGRVAIEQVIVTAFDGLKRGHGAVAAAFALLRQRDAFRLRLLDELLHALLRGGAGARHLAVPGRHSPRGIVINAHMVDLAEAARVVAVVFEVLRHRGDVRHGGAQRAADFENLRRGRIASAEHRDARGRAQRLLHIAVFEDHAAFRQRIDVW